MEPAEMNERTKMAVYESVRQAVRRKELTAFYKLENCVSGQKVVKMV
jgi:hypothetical protein